MSTSSKKSVTTTRSTNVGLLALVKELTTVLDKADARLGPEPPAITGTEKKRTSKPRKGAEKVLGILAPIVRQHGLDSSSLSSDIMVGRLEAAQALLPLQTRMQKMQKRVDDELFSAQSDAWSMGLQFYSLLQRRAKSDGELAQNLEPVTRLFAYRHDSVKATKPTKVQTRVKAKLKKATAVAGRHGITIEGASHAPPAVAAAVPAAAPAAVATNPVAPVAPAIAPAQAPAATPAPVAVAPALVAAAVPAVAAPAQAPVVAAAGASNGVTNGAASAASGNANSHA